MYPTPASPNGTSIPYAALSASPLFVDYCTRYGRVAAFYNGDFRNPSAFETARRRAVERMLDRPTLVDTLLTQQERWGADPETDATLQTLRSPTCGVVVTGQQLGLFVSPLFTLYKTLTAILLARRLSASAGQPVVPVFWMAGEDHDFAEVAGTTLAYDGRLDTVRYPTPPLPGTAVNTGPVGRLRLTEAITESIEAFARALPQTDLTPALLDLLRNTYRPGVLMEDAFARVLRRLTAGTGLILMSIDDPAFKRLAAPLFEREVLGFGDAHRRLVDTSAALSELGYHTQVASRPTNLFLMDDAGRLPIDSDNGRFTLRGTDRSLDEHELLDIARTAPERLSPNVVLRPIVQDFLLPTVAYVAGPGEAAYFAQYKQVYDWAEVPMPIIYPRASVTIIEPGIRKALDRYPFGVSEYAEGVEKLLKQIARTALPVALEQTFGSAERTIHEHIARLRLEAGRIDPSLERSTDAARTKLDRVMHRLQERILRGQKRRMDDDRARLERIATYLFPTGKPQERVLSPLILANRYGLDIFTRLMDRLSLDTWEHQLIDW
jgi:bacillithiol biosynthesis cysteine-adding enzyme BshC